MEIWFRGETDFGCSRGEEVIVMKKGKRERSTQRNIQGEEHTEEYARRKFPQSHWLGNRGAELCTLL